VKCWKTLVAWVWQDLLEGCFKSSWRVCRFGHRLSDYRLLGKDSDDSVCFFICFFVLSTKRTGTGAAVWLSFQTWNGHKTSIPRAFLSSVSLPPSAVPVQCTEVAVPLLPSLPFTLGLQSRILFLHTSKPNLTGILTNLSGMFIVSVTFSRTNSWTASSEGSHQLPSISLPID